MLVLGGSGFLGKHLSEEIRARGHRVTVASRSAVFELDSSSSRVAMSWDGADTTALMQLMSGQEAVVAALPSTAPVYGNTHPYFDSLEFLQRLVEGCVSSGVRLLYFCSSGGAIYGDQKKKRYSESEPLAPISRYGQAKAEAERFLVGYSDSLATRIVSWRFANLYGPGQKFSSAQGLVAVAVGNLLGGVPVTVFGDGSMVRDYSFVADAAKAAAATIGGNPAHDSYNIGSGVGHSVNDVLRQIEAQTGSRITREYVGVPQSFVRRSVLDTSRLQDEFGPIPFRPLDQGIRDFLSSLELEIQTN